MEVQPQMFFLKNYADILPPWLKTPIPALQILDKKISYLSILDSPISMSGLLAQVEVDEQDVWENEIDWEESEEVVNDIPLSASEELTDLEDGNFSDCTYVVCNEVSKLESESPHRETDSQDLMSPAIKSSFYIEGRVDLGARTEYSVKAIDFAINQSTLISGELLCGAFAAVQGVLLEDGTRLATIIVSDLQCLGKPNK